MKLHNIVILTTYTADMFQGYRILFIKARGDDIIYINLQNAKLFKISSRFHLRRVISKWSGFPTS